MIVCILTKKEVKKNCCLPNFKNLAANWRAINNWNNGTNWFCNKLSNALVTCIIFFFFAFSHLYRCDHDHRYSPGPAVEHNKNENVYKNNIALSIHTYPCDTAAENKYDCKLFWILQYFLGSFSGDNVWLLQTKTTAKFKINHKDVTIRIKSEY